MHSRGATSEDFVEKGAFADGVPVTTMSPGASLQNDEQ